MARKKVEPRYVSSRRTAANCEEKKSNNTWPPQQSNQEPSGSAENCSSASYSMTTRNKTKQFCRNNNRNNNNNNAGDSDDYFDKNDKHFNDFNNQLNRIGLMIRNIKGDGNCLFRALCDQMEGHCKNHLFCRAEVVRYMNQNRTDFEPFIEDDVPFDKYMENLGKNGTYGGQDVLVAYSRMRKVNIVIHQLNSPLWHINGGVSKNCMELHLSYHNGEHYSSVRKFGDAGETPANIKLNLASLDSGHVQKQNEKSASKKQNKSFAYDYSANYIDEDEFCDNVDIGDKVQMVMQISGCQDLTLAQQSLIDFNCNVEEAASYVASLLLISESHHDQDCSESSSDTSLQYRAESSCLVDVRDQLLFVDPVVALCDQEDCKSAISPKQQSPSGGNGGGAKPKKIMPVKKHVSNKERKDMKRRERMQRQQTKAAAVKEENSAEILVNMHETEEDLRVTSNLGCLNL